MKDSRKVIISLLAMTVSQSMAFVVQPSTIAPQHQNTLVQLKAAADPSSTNAENEKTARERNIVIDGPRPEQETPETMKAEDITTTTSTTSTVPVEKKKKSIEKKNKSSGMAKDGIFTPLVRLGKAIIGEDNVESIRKKAINAHSNTIGAFVGTSDTEFGKAVLAQLFRMADKNNNGIIEQAELNAALKSLGFENTEVQVAGIFKKADKDKSGGIDLEEWSKAAPMTLKAQLIKLAKRNGNDLGFLS